MLRLVRLALDHEFLHVQPMRLGTGEIIVILFVIVVVFSASRMGALGNAVGKFIYSLRKAAKGEDFIDVKRIPEGSRSKDRKPPEDATIVEEKK
jgi:sec-independent protein translocase protein TatA